MKRISFIAKTVGIPGAFTLASLFAAWSAITLLLLGNFRFAVICSVTAFLLDTVDGFLARKLGKVSEFGKQLDSMIDAINYSVLAALVSSQVLMPDVWGFLVGFVILACGILRLVLFNINGFVTEENKLYYVGVVTPHLTLATALLAFVNLVWATPEWVMAVILLTLGLAQLSTIKTRKSGAIIFWLPMSLLIAVGSLLWF
ncbi:MAG: CDP-alcohol phosphatidyltransferase family protein [Micrococcales bacterium]